MHIILFKHKTYTIENFEEEEISMMTENENTKKQLTYNTHPNLSNEILFHAVYVPPEYKDWPDENGNLYRENIGLLIIIL